MHNLWSKIVRRNINRNNLVTVFMFVFMILYVNDHRKLNELKKEQDPGINIDHKERLRLRKVKLKNICKSLGSPSRVEHRSILEKTIPNNECTGTFFKVDNKRHFICNGLKTGSTSWQVFFAENHINTTHIRDCRADDSCPSTAQTGLRIVQVRHPFERLLSSYRHVIKNGGWKSLDQVWQHDKEVEKSFTKIFSISWREFVEKIIISNGFFISAEDLDNLDFPGTWVKTHWAPFWFTCDLCSPDLAPEMIIKTETLQWDVPEVLERLGMAADISFPDIRVTGTDDNFSEGNRASDEFVVKYFSELSTQDVLRLYEVYKMDFLMFGYSPNSFLELSKDFSAKA